MVTVVPASNDFTNIIDRAMKIKSVCNIPFSDALKVLEISENEKQTALLESIRDRLTAAERADDQSETEQHRRGRPRKEE